MDDPTLEEIHVFPSPLVKILEPSSEVLSLDVTQLQEESNKALWHLLATRCSIDTHWRKQVSESGKALHKNESETTKAIKEAKALCACTIWDVETHQTVLISKGKVWHTGHIKEVEDNCACTLAEAENCCSTAIREAESWVTFKPCSIQQSHAKDIQCLEAEAIKEERRNHLTFLATCGTALRASPPKAHGRMVTPLPPSTRKYSYICPAEPSPGDIPSWTGTCPTGSSFLCLSSDQTLTLVSVVAQLARLGGASVPIWDYLKSDYQGATPFKVEGGDTLP